MECIVLYDFKAQGEDELSINKGSIVKVRWGFYCEITNNCI